ncbi:hypothetical protein FGK63_11015 [Ruegeria sediminis]|uniref:D-galactarate dehydratase n=1 Tax=Ruegeria sediminis TaxID=2583820 RepID=A0ABY2WYM6_9RHOB|nr:hypothetical protein [Ruegeria sediminis]TMV07974.1 hypothetical protein FGK63_11015 [Ruegeria sediminis]
MKRAVLISLVLLAGCDAVRTSSNRLFGGSDRPQNTAADEAVVEDVAAEEVQPTEAVVVDTGWDGAKQTIAGLGDPTKPGRWLETPLVKTEMNGRIVVQRTGAQAYVALVPAPGAEGAGSRLSLEAMQALLVPLDQLVELDVYSN